MIDQTTLPGHYYSILTSPAPITSTDYSTVTKEKLLYISIRFLPLIFKVFGFFTIYCIIKTLKTSLLLEQVFITNTFSLYILCFECNKKQDYPLFFIKKTGPG